MTTMECSICLEELIADIYVLSCKHELHMECAQDWMNANNSPYIKCPLCNSCCEVINVYTIGDTVELIETPRTFDESVIRNVTYQKHKAPKQGVPVSAMATVSASGTAVERKPVCCTIL